MGDLLSKIRELRAKATRGPFAGRSQYIVSVGDDVRCIAHFPRGGGKYIGVPDAARARSDRELVQFVLNHLDEIEKALEEKRP